MSDLVPRPETQLAVANDNFWGDMDQSDFAVPTVFLAQGTSAKGEVGKFNYNNGSAFSKLEGVSLLVPSKTRTLFAGKGKATRCGSDNFHVPSPRYQNPISTNCMTCYAAQWGDDLDKVNLADELGVKKDINPPLCQQTYSMMFLDAGGFPFFMDFRSSALKVVQEKLLSRLRMGFSKSHPTAVLFDMVVNRAESKNGVYFEVGFENFRIASEDRQKLGLEMYNNYSKRAQSIRSDQIAKMDEETEAKAAKEVPWPEAPPPGPDTTDEIPF